MISASATQAHRFPALAETLTQCGTDVFVAWSPVSMGYLAGYFENAHERFLALMVHRSGKVALVCPALSATQAERLGITGIRPWKDGENPLPLFAEVLASWGATGAVVAIDPDMPAHMVLAIQSYCPEIVLRDGRALISGLRKVKSQAEIEIMTAASRIADEAFHAAIPQIRAGLTELDVAAILRSEMKARGGDPTFTIVAAGAGSAEPHHLSDETVLENNQIVLLDFGCQLQSYQSDMTRMICLGKATDKQKSVYRTVWEAHLAGRKAVRPGIKSHEVDASARTVIEQAGYGDAFFHRLGHGIGMEGHEEPNIAPGDQTVLTEGNCFSIEPGIYLAGEFGVRIENLVYVTAEGHVSFNEEPPAELMEI